MSVARGYFADQKDQEKEIFFPSAVLIPAFPNFAVLDSSAEAIGAWCG